MAAVSFRCLASRARFGMSDLPSPMPLQLLVKSLKPLRLLMRSLPIMIVFLKLSTR